jgi:hypothetical protein
MNVQQLQDDVLFRLGEGQASLVAAYMSGTNSSVPVLTSNQAILTLLNDAQNDLARHYYTISDTATYSWPGGQQFTKYAGNNGPPASPTFVCTGNAGNVVFGIRKLNFGGVNLTSAGRAATESWYPNMDTDPQGQPIFYYEDGIEGVGVYPIPAVTATVTAKAIVIPAPLVLETDVPQFPPDRHILLSWFACAQVLARNTEDPVLVSRGNRYEVAYREGAKNILSRTWRLDPDFANDLLADRPVMGPAQAS